MKKTIPILLTISIIFTFFACSYESNINENELKSTTQKQESTMANTSSEDITDSTITVEIGDKSFSAKLYDNETARAFADMLPLTLDMNELNGNEKYFNLESSFPTESLNVGNINSGDIMLYGDNCIVLFYDSFSTEYSYTEIGYIENPAGFDDAVGSENALITFYR